MRAFIRWLFFKKEDSGYIIKNEENNENWPNASTYAKTMEKWQKLINEQQISINRWEIKNNRTKQIKADIQTWFINEYNLLGKPAKKVLLAKEREMQELERELKLHQHNLDHPKEELEEYEKNCLLKKIAIAKRKIGNKKDEIEEAKKATEEEKKELCLRLAYNREDLEPFLGESEGWRVKELQNLLNSVIREDDQPKTACEWYSTWWKKYNDIDPPTHFEFGFSDTPLAKLRSMIDEWYNHNGGQEIDKNPYEIHVEEKTDDSLVFVWEPVEQVIGKDEEGKDIKGIFLPLMKNYLFNYYGEWYEVADYHQVGYKTIVVACQRSIFYNDYWHLNMCQANVILHHSPLSQEEICSCPNSEHYTTRHDFDLDYNLELDFYRLGKNEMKKVVTGKSEGSDFSFAYLGLPQKTSESEEVDKLVGYWNALKATFKGWEGVLFFLLGKRLNDGSFASTYFSIPMTLDDMKRNEKLELLTFRRVSGGFDNEKKITKLSLDDTLTSFLSEEGLLINGGKKHGQVVDNMHHFFKDHIKATLFWRKIPIWHGPYWILYNQALLTETIGADGNCITIEASGMTLARVKELVTCKLGDTKGILGSIITVATTVATVAAVASTGGSAAPIATTAAKAGIALAGGMAQQAANKLTEGVSYSENTQTMSIHEFKHKFFNSGTRPITLRVELSQELSNQYRNKRELKGQMLYTYYNFTVFGKALAQKGLFKASVISWNMTQNSEWFRSKIERQVFLYDEDYQSFYKIELTRGKSPTCRGGITRKSWNEFVFEEKRINKKFIGSVDRSKGSPYHQRGHYFIFYEDGSTDHWLAMYPQGDIAKDLPKGHTHGAFILNFDKPVKKMVDIYTCIGCGAMSTQGYEARTKGFLDLHSGYDSGGNLEIIHKGLSFEPWYSKMSSASLNSANHWITADGDRCLGSSGDVWEKATQEIPGETFTQAYGFIPNNNTITWELSTDETILHKVKNPGENTNPTGIPPSTNLPIDPAYANAPPSTPFNPNQFPSSGNLTPNPTGSGEFEPTVPDIDVSPDPDFDSSLDVDPGQDPDSTQDPEKDKPKDPERPPEEDTNEDD